MNKLQTLGQILNDAFTCPHCGGSRFIRATSWKGHGTGNPQHVHYSATAQEEVHPATHCICPGGPVWQQLVPTRFGQDMRMAVGAKLWDKVQDHSIVVLWSGEDADEEGAWLSIPMDVWRKVLGEVWPELFS